MVIYNKPLEYFGVIVNLTNTTFKAYSSTGEILVISPSKQLISSYRFGVFYIVDNKQYLEISKERTTSDLLYAYEQGYCRNSEFLHKFYTINDKIRVYPKGE